MFDFLSHMVPQMQPLMPMKGSAVFAIVREDPRRSHQGMRKRKEHDGVYDILRMAIYARKNQGLRFAIDRET